MRFRRILRVVFVLYWLTMATSTHLPPPQLPKVNVNDKVAHVVAFGLWAMLAVAVVRCTWPGARQLPLLVAPIGLLYGAVDEWTQPMFGRFCELRDWLADGLGLAIGVSLMMLLLALVGKRRPANQDQPST